MLAGRKKGRILHHFFGFFGFFRPLDDTTVFTVCCRGPGDGADAGS